MIKNLLLLSLFILTAAFTTAQEGTKIKISTEFGDMIAVLYDDTPLHKENFLKNIKNGTYDGALFHRVIHGFMAQGGDPNSIGSEITEVLGNDDCPTIKNEISYKHIHKKGALSAARLPDGSNPEKESSGCQFFIVQGYIHNDAQLDAMENEKYRFPDVNRAIYKIRGGTPALDMQYTVFGEVIEGLDIIDMIHAMPTGYYKVKDRPNTDVKFTITILK